MKTIAVAIDGPSGAGKSSVSRIVGERLGYLHVDSGALYRIMTWQCLERGVDTGDEAAVAAFAQELDVECRPEDGHVAYYVGGELPGDRIRKPEINAHASKVATVKAVRERITALLRGMTAYGNLIIEGRDITSAVFPDSPARFYLTASAEARARRRTAELLAKGMDVKYETVLEEMILRDRNDSTRKIAPAVPAEDAVFLDNSDLTAEETIARAIEIIEAKAAR